MPQPVHDRVARREGQHDPDRSDQGRLQTRAEELVDIGLEADLEEEDQHAELGEGVQDLRLVDQPEQAGTDEHPRQQLAQDGSLPDALHGLAGQLGGEPDQDEP